MKWPGDEAAYMKGKRLLLIGLFVLFCISLVAFRIYNYIDWCKSAIGVRDGKVMCTELIGYLENNDAEGIKNMLSEETMSSPVIDMEIAAAVELFDGKVTSPSDVEMFERRMGNYIEEETRYLVTSMDVRLKTDKDRSYVMELHAQFTSDEESDAVGVYLITIYDESGHTCIIGKQLDNEVY